MLRRCLTKYLVILTLCWIATIMGTTNAIAAGTEDARRFADTLGSRVLEVVNSSQGEAQKQAQFQQLFSENVDIDWMGKFVLGNAWQQANPEQRERYMQVYRDYLLAHYTTNFADYGGSNYVITGARDDGNGRYTVNMKVKTPTQKEETAAGYRLRSENGQFKIFDIIIEGVSLITTQRSEFSASVQKGGMDGLIGDLTAKASAEKKS